MGTPPQIQVVPVEWADELVDEIEAALETTGTGTAHAHILRAAVAAYRERAAELADMLAAAPAATGPPQEPRRAPEPSSPRKPPAPAAHAFQQRQAQEARERVERLVARAKKLLASGGARSSRELRDHLGASEHVGTLALRALAADPDVEVTGATKSRRYGLTPAATRRAANAARQAAATPGARNSSSMTAGGVNTSARQEPTLEGRMLSFCHLPRTVDELLAEFGDDTDDDLYELLKRLTASDDLRLDGRGYYLAHV